MGLEQAVVGGFGHSPQFGMQGCNFSVLDNDRSLGHSANGNRGFIDLTIEDKASGTDWLEKQVP